MIAKPLKCGTRWVDKVTNMSGKGRGKAIQNIKGTFYVMKGFLKHNRRQNKR